MPILPPGGETPIGYVVSDVCNDALIETGAVAPGEIADADLMQWAFRQFNDLMNMWQAIRSRVYSYNFTLFNLVAGLAPHTIGPGPGSTFYMPQRPVRIESCALIFNISGSPIDLPMNIRDKDWWANQKVKSIQTNVPTDLYYDPAWPNGNCFFWPVPNTTNQVRIQTWQNISEFASITDPIGGPGGPNTLPPAYRPALKYTLAEFILPGSNRALHPVLARKALMARTAIGLNNDKSPRIRTQDSGMPAGNSIRGDFNWATGGRPGGPPE